MTSIEVKVTLADKYSTPVDIKITHADMFFFIYPTQIKKIVCEVLSHFAITAQNIWFTDTICAVIAIQLNTFHIIYIIFVGV